MSAACMVFKSMFSPTLEIVNAILGTQLGWLESRSTALYTIIILTVWMGIGLSLIHISGIHVCVQKQRVLKLHIIYPYLDLNSGVP